MPATSTNPSERAKQFVRVWQRQLRRKPTIVEGAAMRRAGELAAVAELVRARVLAGTASVDDLVRADGAARRAARDLEAVFAKRPAPALPSLQELMGM